MNKDVFLGIDIGSSATKIVIINENENFVDKIVYRKGVGNIDIDKIVNALFEKNGLEPNNCLAQVATGYGRMSYKMADGHMSEISCHAKGVHKMIPEARTIIDIGGQDSKVIRISEKGILQEFVMNDKCAAGTGRFLDMMSNVLGVTVENMGDIGLKAKSPLTISNTCAVFAESEVISLLSTGEKIDDIIAGIHISIAKKTAALVRRIGVKDSVVLTGGVAQNKSILNEIRNELNTGVILPAAPQFTGAIGAALYALEKYRGNKEE